MSVTQRRVQENSPLGDRQGRFYGHGYGVGGVGGIPGM